MRIGLVVERLDPLRGGLEQWTWQFAKYLVGLGHEVHVVSRGFSPVTASLPIIRHLLKHADSRLGFASAAEAALRRLRLDRIHDMGCGWCCDIFQPHGGSWLSVMQRKMLLNSAWIRPLKRWIDPLLPRQRAMRSLLARQYGSDRCLFVAVSRSVAVDLQRHHNVPPERIRVVYNGVDTEKFSPNRCAKLRESAREQLGIPETAVTALVVAHNFRLKGVPTLLRATSQLAAGDVPIHLLVVGGKRLAPWRRMAHRLGVADRTTFLGTVEDVVPCYAAADMYVHPTYYDPCSLVLLEAASCGLPLITTKESNGVAELLTEGKNVLFLSDASDTVELAHQMRTLIDMDRRRLGDAAREAVAQQTFARNFEQMLSVYSETPRRELLVA